ncbi:noncanonical pyrimidine nucleotidase, YjjG family, partial [Bacillus cereus]
DKSSVLMVGDSLTSDMKGGEDYSIDTCWYNPSLKENGTDVNPTYEVESLLQILEIVEVAEEKVASF